MADWPDPPWHTYQHDKLRSSSKLSVLSFFRYTVKYLSCCISVQWIWEFEHAPIKLGSWSSWYRRTHVIVIQIVTSWTVSGGYQWIIAQKWWHRELHTKNLKKIVKYIWLHSGTNVRYVSIIFLWFLDFFLFGKGGKDFMNASEVYLQRVGQLVLFTMCRSLFDKDNIAEIVHQPLKCKCPALSSIEEWSWGVPTKKINLRIGRIE